MKKPTIGLFYSCVGHWTLAAQRAGLKVLWHVQPNIYDFKKADLGIDSILHANWPKIETCSRNSWIEPEYMANTNIIAGSPPCLSPNELILSSAGSVPIKNVHVGDMVHTHLGNLKPVTKVMQHQFTGKLMSIQLSHMPLPFNVTPDHPILTNYGWILANKLNTAQYVAFGLRDVTYHPPRFRYLGQVNQYNTSKVENINTTTKSFWKLIGLYLAEGWRRARRQWIYFGCDKSEVKLFCKIITNVIDREPQIQDSTGRGRKIVICHRGLWQFLERFGHGARYKHIPMNIELLEHSLAKSLLEGMLIGDGSLKNDRIRYTTASRQLAESFQRVYLRAYNLLPTCKIYKEKTASIIDGRVILPTRLFHLEVKDRNRLYGRIGNLIYNKITEIKQSAYIGQVYNLEVADDNSYSTHFASLHNCVGISCANPEAGVNHPANKNMFEFFKLVMDRRPDLFVMEMVPTIVTVGKPILVKLQKMIAREYGVGFGEFHIEDYGSPSRRDRYYFLGMKRSIEQRHPPVPILESLPKAKSPGVKAVTADLSVIYDRMKPDNRELMSRYDSKKKLRSGPYSIITKRGDKLLLDPRLPSYTITGTSYCNALHWTRNRFEPKEYRFLGRLEIQRLMGFPDDFDFNPSKRKLQAPTYSKLAASGVQIDFTAKLLKHIVKSVYGVGSKLK